MKLYSTALAAARAYARHHGITGRSGGWLYFHDGTRHEPVPGDVTVKGWGALINSLKERGILVEKPGNCFALSNVEHSLQGVQP